LYCQASGFCAVRGKQICKPAQLAAACGTSAFPYGAAYDLAACNGVDLGQKTTVPVASLPKCVSLVFGGAVFDLSGNVAELVPPSAGTYAAVGGSFETEKDGLQCAAKAPATSSSVSPSVGFRCCTTE
jgi:hypothetical protein